MIIATNKKAYFDYTIMDTITAGLVLTGAEVKSAKNGNVSLQGSFVTVTTHGANLLGCHIGPYQYAPNEGYNPTHTRNLLLNKHEINKFLGKEKGLVIVPLEMFTTPRGLVKLKIGLARAKKKTDKREYIKKKEAKKEINFISKN